MAEVVAKQARVRSPAYPNIGLKESIDKAAILYRDEGQGRHPIPIASVARRWNYNTVNGSAQAAISALKQFGLMDDIPDCDPRQFRLTARAVAIIVRAAGSPEQEKAIREAAIQPKLYSGLLKKFPLPLPSDDTLREYFIIDLKFNEKQVAGAIKDFREAISFAKLGSSDKIEDDNSIEDDDEMLNQDDSLKGSQAQTSPPAAKSPPAGMTQDTLTIGGQVALIRLPANLSQDQFDDLQDWIKLKLRMTARESGLKPAPAN